MLRPCPTDQESVWMEFDCRLGINLTAKIALRQKLETMHPYYYTV
jgi:hypothetical protein